MGQEQRCWRKEDKTNQLLFKFDNTSRRLISSKLGVAILQFLQKQINIMAISHLLNFSAGAQWGGGGEEYEKDRVGKKPLRECHPLPTGHCSMAFQQGP